VQPNAYTKILSLSPERAPEAAVLVAHALYPNGYNAEQLHAAKVSLQRQLTVSYMDTLVAELNGTLVGFAFVNWGFSIRKGQPFAHIQLIFTLPSHRRMGIGRQLLESVKQLALERGACRVELETDTDNLNARTLYESVGYEWLRDKEVYMLFFDK